MNRDIVIFGKNSVLAQNFIASMEISGDNKILISRKSNINDHFVFDISDLKNEFDLNLICSKIEKNSKFKEKILILFSWSGGPRTLNKDLDNWILNKNIILNFLSISKILNPKRIIFISSAGSIYPSNINIKYCESDKTCPSNKHGKQKLYAESMIKNFVKEEKIQYTILRIASAYGYDRRFSDQGVINKWLYSAIRGEILKLYNSKSSLINFIAFDQISNAIKVSIEKEINGTFNIGTENSITLQAILKEIQRVINKKINIKIEGKETRYFNIDVNKFFLKTGIKYENRIRENIKSIYNSIISNDI